MPTDRSLLIALPGLVERFDDVDAKILALAARQNVMKHTRLVRR